MTPLIPVDERRLAHLATKLNSMEVQVSSSAATSSRSMIGGGKTSSVGRSDTAFAGGIFSRLEAQFRAQQAAKALSLQGTQTRYICRMYMLEQSLYYV